MELIDIGANLTDTMYAGEYNGSSRHPPDLPAVLGRARAAGVSRMIVTGGSLEESRRAVALAKEHGGYLFATVGCHPTRCNEFSEDPDGYYNSLLQLIRDNRDEVVAVGECGLDYDRTKFCEKDVQRRYFERQLELCSATGLPLFLHCRAAGDDVVEILRENLDRLAARGVVHSFDGSEAERDAILGLGFHIGINGCSLKTEENLKVVAGIPADRLMLETDCPWCEVRPSHAGHKFVKTRAEAVDKKKWREGVAVKGRNEPHNMRQVLEIVAAVRQEDQQELARTVAENTMGVFFKSR